MKSNPRAKPTGQTLMSQGEPMVWLTGGMFAIACTMIMSLLGFILYQGLSTHWQRAFAIYPLNNGGVLAGELQNKQPYTISKQSLNELDETSRKNAEKLLAGREQAASSQLYLRTGNFDIGNRHFAFVPEIGLSSRTPYLPTDVWLLERREWGVLYGFPIRLKIGFTPDHDMQYSQLALLANQIDQFNATLPDADTLKDKLTRHLHMLAAKLVSDFERIDSSTNAQDKITDATQSAMKRIAISHRQMEVSKKELGRADHVLSNCRLVIRKAELADKTDLQTVSDEAIQLTSAEGTIKAQTEETLNSLLLWENEFANDADALKSLKQVREAVVKQQSEILQSMTESIDSIKKTIGALLPRSKRAIESAMEKAIDATQTQYTINTRIARLEAIHKSQFLEVQVPIPATQPLVDPKFDGSPLKSIELSQSQSLVLSSSEGQAPKYHLSVRDPSNQKTILLELQSKDVLISDIVRFTKPNQLSILGKLALYFERWFEFLFGQPREAGIEGGFFPAIWGTIVMTLIMSVAVMPFGVIAALYMREYAKNGWILSLIRISINNLAGVPSIVYGVFGLAFFCYTIGGFIDGGPIKSGFVAWPTSTWFVAMAVTALSGTAGFFLAFMGSGSPTQMSKTRKRITGLSGLFWLVCLIGLVALMAKSPFFNGFYEASLPNPTFGKGCLLWASCTLALLTLPVVIVATEEALSAVPNSLREGSYACGAGKWQTLQRIVLPYARPGIITGFILAMARGAGEVAPMMLVGAIPLATELPLDLEFPFFHGSRSFMHLGFQIYSLGFQSQNSEAAKPMVFTATLLLLTIVTLLNVTAIWLRARLRKRFQGSQF